ncbi:hypothetical protein D3C72_2152520 [compost metagenome]
MVRKVQQDGVAVPDGGAAIGQRGDLLEGADALKLRRLVLAGQHVDEGALVVLADEGKKKPDLVAVAGAGVVVEGQHAVAPCEGGPAGKGRLRAAAWNARAGGSGRN